MFSFVIRFIGAVVVLASLQFSQAATPTSQPHTPEVVFLNPGFSNEPFWVTYSQFMHAAAKNLGLNLSVIYGERDRENIIQSARALAENDTKPDYVIFVNEMYVGPEILRIFSDSSVKLFSLHSTLTPEQQEISGGTRERYENWIGSIIANDEDAGYLMAKELISKTNGAPAEMLAFAGVRSTPSSTLRERGLLRALTEHPEIKLHQVVFGEWSEQRAYDQAKILLKRYNTPRLVWSANDEMAFGVMKAAREMGKVPGQDLYLSGLNNSDRVLQARVNNEISALASGHFSLGGWALVMLHDYHAGEDFAKRGGKDRVDNLFTLLDAEQARQLMLHLKIPDYELNFKDFSAVYHPELENYQFSIQSLTH